MESNRVDVLEEKVAWLEHRLSEMDEVLRQAMDEVVRLRRELGDMGTGLRELEHAVGSHEKPPHY